MVIMCPIHHCELEIKQLRLQIFGVDRFLHGAECKKCGKIYINHSPFQSSSEFQLDGKHYQVLGELEKIQPYNKNEEDLLRKQFEIQQQEKNQKEKAKKKREKEQQKLKNKMEDKFQLEWKKYSERPNLLYIPTFVSVIPDDQEMPSSCPFCGKPLIWLENIRHKQGYCCLKCGRKFQTASQKAKEDTQKRDAEREKNRQARNLRKLENQNTESKKTALELPEKLKRLPEKDYPKFKGAHTILSAKLLIQRRIVKYISLVDINDFQSTDKGIYWIGRRLANVIFLAIMQEKKITYYKECRIEILDFKTYSIFKEYQKRYDMFCKTEEIMPIYVFKNKKPSDPNIEVVTAYIYYPEKETTLPISVYFSANEDRYYINYETYNKYVAMYGIPRLNPIIYDDMETMDDSGRFLNPISKLKTLGYTVSKQKGMTSTERQSLLRQIIESGLMTKSEIMGHLEFLINLHDYDIAWSDPVSAWQEDLNFVMCYKMEKQRMIHGKII